MREKELRVALVCFGGVSLAVYMHGISKEVLKLVRASCALHAVKDRRRRAETSYFDLADAGDPEFDTEEFYFELLREIGREVELRVLVDIIAGASAGGINGAMLARAISHDLRMDPLRDLWLDKADVAVLLAPEARPKVLSKWILRPVIWSAAATGMLRAIKDREVRAKVSLFVRSRWFKPPLDGLGMAGLMYDAVTAMGAPKSASASLLPEGHQLDLFVTVTDYHGYDQLMQLHDPPLIHEREHRHVLQFSYRRRPGSKIDSDFELANAPALAFAARATSSFPGAFPPARIVEMDQLMAARGGEWPDRERFLRKNFAAYRRAEVDPTTTSFIDGAVLNNRPFREAIAAVHGRPAYREVDRRLVYIDPEPAPQRSKPHKSVPGFFATLKGAISDIPRNQPVTDELAWVYDFNQRMRGLRSVIEEARPQVSALVTDVVADSFDRAASADMVRAWREDVNHRVAREAGFAYQGYVRLKLASVRDYVARLIIALREAPPRSPLARIISETVDAWALRTGLSYDLGTSCALGEEAQAKEQPAWVNFLLAFDVEYRKRRLHFMIEGQNRLYKMLGRDRFSGLDPALIDALKRDFYRCLETLRRSEQQSFFSHAARALAAELFADEPSAEQARDVARHAQEFVAQNGERISGLVEQLATDIDLQKSTRDVDALLATLDPHRWQSEARMEVLINYLGFPFWDVLTFPLTTAREAGEFHEIRIDRISPQDARTLAKFHDLGLKGVGFGHFAAFLSRAYREHDYLVGRLHALDRLIDIVCDSAGADAISTIDVAELKRRAFRRVLDVESRHLTASKELLASLRRRLDELADTSSR